MLIKGNKTKFNEIYGLKNQIQYIAAYYQNDIQISKNDFIDHSYNVIDAIDNVVKKLEETKQDIHKRRVDISNHILFTRYYNES